MCVATQAASTDGRRPSWLMECNRSWVTCAFSGRSVLDCYLVPLPSPFCFSLIVVHDSFAGGARACFGDHLRRTFARPRRWHHLCRLSVRSRSGRVRRAISVVRPRRAFIVAGVLVLAPCHSRRSSVARLFPATSFGCTSSLRWRCPSATTPFPSLPWPLASALPIRRCRLSVALRPRFRRRRACWIGTWHPMGLALVRRSAADPPWPAR